MTDSAPAPGTWGFCGFCGVAVPEGAAKCPICGATDLVPAGRVAAAPKSIRRRIRWTATLRSVIVVGAALALAYTLVAAVLAGPPTVPDPLTTSGSYLIGPGNYTVISGNITGGDYIQGNYSAMNPPGMDIDVAVYNSSEWSWFTNGTGSSGAQWTNTPGWDGAIVFSAAYTDVYYFVFTNPLPSSSGITIEVYIATVYESNVAEDGGV
ncbi:MAG: emp24/gp25L/p24 family protein [Thermoplasmata archaeon]